MASSWLVRLVYDERVPFLSERMFRSRDVYDVEFYLRLTAPARLALTAGIVGLAVLIGLRALLGDTAFGGNLGWPGLMRLLAWSPASRRAQTAAVLACGAAVGLASGYQAVPSLGNDIVTYMPAARKHFDKTYLIGDLPIRDPDAALLAWGWIVRVLVVPFGFEGAFFAVSMLGSALLAYGVHRLVATALGAGHRAGMLAAMVGLTATFGSFGYALSVPSHAAFYPTPRFLAIAISVVAVSLVLERAFVRAVLLGLVSTAVNTLDGLIPVGLAILAVVLIEGAQTRSGDPSRRLPRGIAMAALAMVVASVAVRLEYVSGASTLAKLLPGSLVVVTVGFFVGLAGWLSGTKDRSLGLSGPSPALAAGVTLGVGGALLASRRSAGGGSGFVEGVVAFETVLQQVRASSSMLILSATSPPTALIFVALLLTAVALLLDASVHPSAVGSGRPRVWGARHAAGLLALLSAGFIALGSSLMERTELPFIVTLWPVRVAWVVVLVFVAALGVSLGEHGSLRRVGVLPALGFGVIMLQDAAMSRSAWSIGLLAVACVWVVIRETRPAGRSVTDLSSRPAGQVLVVCAMIFFMAGVSKGFEAPDVRIADSMSRIEARGGIHAEVVQMARAANAVTPLDARILIPPNPSWGAFRLLSERGVAFEWKNFSTAQPLEWYRQLRRMCDPDYLVDEAEDFSVGLRHIERCHAALSAIEIRRVADAFDADFAVIRSEIAQSMSVVAVSESGEHVLVRLR